MESKPQQILKPQPVKRFSSALTIYAADYPIYYIECISERHFIIAGGGGSSKFGVHNQINIVELVPTGDSCAANLVMKFKTPEELPDAIMAGSLSKNSSIANTSFLTGGTDAAIYHITFDPHNKGFSIKNYEILKDSKIKGEIKSVKYLADKILTGGEGGQLLLWDAGPDPKKVEMHVKAHSKAISEIDVDLVSQQIVTLSREEGRCAIWNLTNLKLLHEFKKDAINHVNPGGDGSQPTKYNFRSCKYAYDATLDTSKKPGNSFLLVACNPTTPRSPCKIHRWPTHDFKNSTSAIVTHDGIMAMTISLDGKLVAVGTGSGSVSVFEVKNFRQIYSIEQAHHNSVTSLEFLTPKPESLSLTNSELCPLLSVSIDRRIVLHRPRKSSMLVKFLKTAFLAFLIYVLFFILQRSYTKDSTDSNGMPVTEVPSNSDTF